MSLVETQDTATPTLRALYARLAPPARRPLMRVLGQAAEVELRIWFRARNAEPNRRAWPKQQFWARIRRATANDPARTSDTQATVVIADPAMAAKVRGATIRPKEARALAIPLRAEAYGVRPASGLIPNLFLLATARGVFLARREGRALRVYYRLVPSVTVPADAKALPPTARMDAALLRAATIHLRPKS